MDEDCRNLLKGNTRDSWLANQKPRSEASFGHFGTGGLGRTVVGSRSGRTAAQVSACITCRTGTNRSAFAGSVPSGTNTVRRPAALAAESRAAIPGAGRTTPVNPISPTNADADGAGTPAAAEATAAATARSQAGSSSLAPPATAPKTSERPRP